MDISGISLGLSCAAVVNVSLVMLVGALNTVRAEESRTQRCPHTLPSLSELLASVYTAFISHLYIFIYGRCFQLPGRVLINGRHTRWRRCGLADSLKADESEGKQRWSRLPPHAWSVWLNSGLVSEPTQSVDLCSLIWKQRIHRRASVHPDEGLLLLDREFN